LIIDVLEIFSMKIMALRGGSPQKKLPKIQPQFDRAPQNKWSPRASPQLSAHILGLMRSKNKKIMFYAIYIEKNLAKKFFPLLCKLTQERFLGFWTSGPKQSRPEQ